MIKRRRNFRQIEMKSKNPDSLPKMKGILKTPAPGFAGPRGAISVVRAFCMATGHVPVHMFDFSSDRAN
jgi:hypothetical protein